MEIAQSFEGRSVRWIAVHDPGLTSFDDLDKKLSNFEKNVWDRKMSLETVIDVAAKPGDRNGISADRYGVHDWPTLVLIGKDGKVFGTSSKSELSETLNELLGRRSVEPSP